ncbi:MAG: hypothetical protein GY854_32405 [Deltaproteobacteria bacterium]|nr:hypothetical protein [Deltaproteobacteria bacterium]
MSIGGDIVSEAIALFQPIKNSFTVNIREYSGELDDIAKDNFVLPSYLFVMDGGEGSSLTDQEKVSTIMIEFNGVDHEPQDGSNLVYLNTYRVNVWIVCGYNLTTQHKQGGEFLDQEEGYGLYDAVLDLLAGRKLIKDAENVRFTRGERVYFGNLDNPQEAPLIITGGENSASVYKLEFSIKAQSVWEQFGGSPGYPSLKDGGAKADDVDVDDAAGEDTRLTRVGDPWYVAAGPLNEQGGMSVDMEIIINDAYVDFNERTVQQLPNDRVTWRSTFPFIQLPSAIFPCTDKPGFGTSSLGPEHRINDVVDGYPLVYQCNVDDEHDVLYRRTAAGLYTQSYRDLISYSPRRCLEFTQDATFEAEKHDSISPDLILDPFDPEGGTASHLAFSGFVVARATSPGLLMGKYVGEEPSSGEASNGWQLAVNDSGYMELSLWNAGADGDRVAVIKKNHLDGQWFGVLFSVDGTSSDSPAIRLYSPHGYLIDGVYPDDLNGDIEGEWNRPWVPIDVEGPVIPGSFKLGGAVGQLGFAAYWQGPVKHYDVANMVNYHYLWRGTTNPVNIAKSPGLVLSRGSVMAWPVNRPLGGGESVCKFAENGEVVSHDHYTVQDNVRVMPFDRDRENLLIHSEAFEEAAWNATPTLAGPDTTGPDGMLSAYTLGATDTIQQNSVSVTVGASLVFSVWARSANAGEVTLGAGGSTEEIQLTKKWARVHMGVVATSGTLDVSIAAGEEDIEIWGAQLEEGLLAYNATTKEGSDPTGYIPTGSSPSGLVGIDECYVDWEVLPGPMAEHGKVQIMLLPGKDMLGSPDGDEFTAFQLQPENGTGEYLKVFGELGTTTVLGETKRTITWHMVGEIGSLDPVVDAPTAVVIEEGAPLTVAVRWHVRGLELWVENEAVALAGGEYLFSADPTKCHLLRNVENISVSSSSNWDDSNWIGACKEVRWWR